jgi:predicted HTH transcriptional regulator
MSVSDEEHSETFQQYRDFARVATEWLDLFSKESSPADLLLAELRGGESISREFKSSLRWHIHKKQHDEVITHACLKTIAAFLNSDEGGVLLIGVEDSGAICGIEHDGFANDDKFLLHLYNYVQEWLGNQHATRIKTDLVTVDGKKVCRVECQPFAGDWAYLRRKGEEEFLVRVGPSSKPLKPSEIATYMASRKSS